MVELERLIKEDVELDKLSDTKLNELILEKYGIDFNEYGKSIGKVISKDDKLMFIFYHTSILDNVRVQKIDLKEDKNANFKKFLALLSSQKTKNFDDLVTSIYKSYCEIGREREILSYLDLKDTKVKNLNFGAFIYKFLNDFIYTENDDDIKVEGVTKIADIKNEIYALIDKKVSGNLVAFYLDFSRIYKNSIMDKFYNYLTSTKGYLTYNGLENLFFKKEDNVRRDSGLSQDDLVEMYVNFVQNVVKGYRENNTSTRSYNKNDNSEIEWKLMISFKEHLESYMTEETLNLDIVKICQEKASFLYDAFALKEYQKKSSYNEHFGEYYISVRDALAHPNTEGNQITIQLFIEDVIRVKKALETTDKPGKIYSLNYFKVMDIDPYYFCHLITLTSRAVEKERNEYISKVKKALVKGEVEGDLSKLIVNFKSKIVDKKTLKFMEETRGLVNMAFGDTKKVNKDVHAFDNHIDRLSDAVKYVAKLMDLDNAYQINGLGVEDIKQLPSRVEKVIKDNKLPTLVSCIREVYRACINGEKPLYFPENSKNYVKETVKI